MSKARALRLIAEAGGDWDEWGESTGELLGNVDAPAGMVWRSTGCHTIAVGYSTDRAAGWRFIIAEVEQGTEPCDDPECEACR